MNKIGTIEMVGTGFGEHLGPYPKITIGGYVLPITSSSITSAVDDLSVITLTMQLRCLDVVERKEGTISSLAEHAAVVANAQKCSIVITATPTEDQSAKKQSRYSARKTKDTQTI